MSKLIRVVGVHDHDGDAEILEFFRRCRPGAVAGGNEDVGMQVDDFFVIDLAFALPDEHVFGEAVVKAFLVLVNVIIDPRHAFDRADGGDEFGVVGVFDDSPAGGAFQLDFPAQAVGDG